jgi:hypothetical protein
MQIWLPRLSNICGIQGGRNIFDLKKKHIQFHFMVPGFKLKKYASMLSKLQTFYPNYQIKIKKFTPGSGMLNTDPDPPDQVNEKIRNQDLDMRIRTEIL